MTSERIKKRRTDLGLSIRALAERTGLAPSTIMRYERGDIENMGIDKIELFSKALHCTPAYLMGWEDEYYLSSDILAYAKELFEDAELRKCYEALRLVDPADLKRILTIIRSFQDIADPSA